MSIRTFQLLIIEDEPDMSKFISDMFNSKFQDINITIVSCRDEAFEIIQCPDFLFDYITLDLNIPIIPNGFEKSPTNGLAVLAKCVTDFKGTPVLIFTGTSTVDMIHDFLSSSVRTDIWGSGIERPTVSHLRKENLIDLNNIIDDIKCDFDAIFKVEFVFDTNHIVLPIKHDRLLRIFSKKHGSAITKIKRIGGGLSKAKVYALELSNEHGKTFLRAISKCGPTKKIEEDASNYTTFVSRLTPGATPRKLDLLTHGASTNSAVFYSLANGYDYSFFKACEQNLLNVEIYSNIQEILEAWYDMKFTKNISIRSIRQQLLSDSDADSIIQQYNIDKAKQFEENIISCNISVQHGDLHGENILINVNKKNATLIDYGDISEMVGIIDPITLECSFLFHPSANKYEWPTDFNLDNWYLIDEYLKDCPISEHIRFCRDWTNSRKRGNREVSACLYAYALRQLKYPETNKHIAKKLISSAFSLFDVS